MPRVRERTTARGLVDPQVYERAIYAVLNRGQSVRASAKEHGVCRITLLQYVHRQMKEGSDARKPGYRPHNRVFTDAQESKLKNYLIKSSEIFFGLGRQEVRILAFQLAKKYGCKYPKSWEDNGMTGKDWFSNFMQRNPILSIRRPQATSLSRATSFNPTNLAHFYNNLENVLQRHQFQPKDILNVDETGTVTVQVPSKLVAVKGRKQVGYMTYAERGTLVTLALAVNAQGNSIPPHFVFPRKKYFDHFVRDGPPGSIGSCSGSGWMQENDFLIFLNHFVNHSRASPEAKVLLLLDNHASHLSLAAIDYCRANGVVLLSFPPHCSHRLQPLDRSVFRSLKSSIHKTMDRWMVHNPGKTMSIYDIPSIVAQALPSAVSQSNITAGFRCTGISPFNRNIFKEEDFLPAYVTDRPVTAPPAAALSPSPPAAALSPSPPAAALSPSPPAATLSPSPPAATLSPSPPAAPASPIPPATTVSPIPPTATATVVPVGTALPTPSTSTGEDADDQFSPEVLRPFPKAGPRKEQRRARKRRSTAILTDTPVKRALEEERAKKVTGNNTKAKRKLHKDRSAKKATPTQQASSSAHAEDTECLCCGEKFSSSMPGEVWVQCMFCEKWAHEMCTEGDVHYICYNCDEF